MMSGLVVGGFASTGPDARTYKRDKDGRFGSGGGGLHENDAAIRQAFEYADTKTGLVTYVPADENPHDGQTTDLSIWQADRSAPPAVDGPLNEQIKAILAQIDDPPTTYTNTAPRVVNISPNTIDLSAVQADWENHLDALLGVWVGITADQRDQIVDQVRSAITSDDVAALARLSVSVAAATEALQQAMTEMALTAAQQLSTEARQQDVKLDPVASDSAEFHVIAAALTALLAEGLTNAAGREALRRWSAAATGDDVSAAVREHLDSLSDSFLRDNLGGALTSAQNMGRMNTALSGPSAAVYASEQMDKNTCKPCREVNGKWLGNIDDPDIVGKVSAVYPNGGYVSCLGGSRCRGTTVYVWRPEQVTGAE